MWKPDAPEAIRPLELHFRMKEAFGLPDGIVYRNEIAFHAPVRPGDRVRTTESVREIGEFRESRVGRGRNWTIDVTYRNQHDEIVGVETYEMFSYIREEALVRPVAARGAAGRRCPGLDVDVTAARRDHGGVRQPGLAAAAPRPCVGGREGRDEGHLPEHPEPRRLVRAVPDRLDGTERTARTAPVPDAPVHLRRATGCRSPGR